MEEVKIDIAIDFSPKLGGRWESLGPNSGEKFYKEHLKIKFEEAIEKEVKLHIYMDGARGYGSSFLDQSFGELARTFGVKKVNDTLIFHTLAFKWNLEYLKNEIWGIS